MLSLLQLQAFPILIYRISKKILVDADVIIKMYWG